MTPHQKPEMRLDPLTNAWTVFSSQRRMRPVLPGTDDDFPPSESPFSGGSESFAPRALYQTKVADETSAPWSVRVIPNRAPILSVEGDVGRRSDGFYDHMDGLGAHEVIVEDPDGRPIESLSLPHIAEVIKGWKSRMLDLMRDIRLRQFLIIRNVGTSAGGMVPHAVSQLLAFSLVPSTMRQKLASAQAFYENKRRSIFAEILSEEVRVGSRLVYENNGFAVFCPYASRAPFELTIYPKRQCADFHGITDQEVAQAADVLKTALSKLARSLDRPAYNLALFTAPNRTQRKDHWNTIDDDFRWHIEIVPRLYPTSGFELATGFYLNSVWPEEAAEYLRKLEVG